MICALGFALRFAPCLCRRQQRRVAVHVEAQIKALVDSTRQQRKRPLLNLAPA